MQNNHEELWSEVDLVNPGFLGSWEEFKDDTSVPIKLGRTKTADDAAVEEGNQVRDWLKTKLKSFYLQRRKIDVLKDDLPEKNERVVFCELSPLQKRLYQHLMTLPDFVLVKYGNAPCECGINQAIFQGFKHMRTEKEKLLTNETIGMTLFRENHAVINDHLIFSVLRTARNSTTPAPLFGGGSTRSLCMVKRKGPQSAKAALTVSHFQSLTNCTSFRLMFRCCNFQNIQRTTWKVLEHGKMLKRDLDFAKVAFPDDVLELLPGGSYIREDGIMDDHSNLSGK
jgi:hypothetical protein